MNQYTTDEVYQAAKVYDRLLCWLGSNNPNKILAELSESEGISLLRMIHDNDFKAAVYERIAPEIE